MYWYSHPVSLISGASFCVHWGMLLWPAGHRGWIYRPEPAGVRVSFVVPIRGPVHPRHLGADAPGCDAGGTRGVDASRERVTRRVGIDPQCEYLVQLYAYAYGVYPHGPARLHVAFGGARRFVASFSVF